MTLTIWPCTALGIPTNEWRQHERWMVLDVTEGLGESLPLSGVLTRNEAHAEMMRMRRDKATK